MTNVRKITSDRHNFSNTCTVKYGNLLIPSGVSILRIRTVESRNRRVAEQVKDSQMNEKIFQVMLWKNTIMLNVVTLLMASCVGISSQASGPMPLKGTETQD